MPEQSPPASPARAPDWRQQTEARQLEALPAGHVAVTCSAPFGAGGLGRHVEEIAQALERGGRSVESLAGGLVSWAGAAPLPPGLRARAFAAEFDIRAARALAPAEHLIAFNGQSLRQQQSARRRGARSVALVSANSHMRRVVRQHQRALSRYPLEQSWARWMLPRNLREYAAADEVLYASQYIRESFLEEGFEESRLRWFPLTPDRRFDGACPARRAAGTFEIVYSGSLAVHKGVPLLIDAFRRLEHSDMRLVLVGGWGSRGMRRFVQHACAADPRISAGPGDPLRALRGASLCVHAAWEDGFAYAPAEAYVAGVPVLVSEDTGMKDMISSPDRGLVLATGDLDALTESIDAAYRGEILRG
jgi:glycosyltransferase involved in cell wall biosynthesis